MKGGELWAGCFTEGLPRPPIGSSDIPAHLRTLEKQARHEHCLWSILGKARHIGGESWRLKSRVDRFSSYHVGNNH